MFTEVTNVQNSILFLGTARETLSNLIEQTELEGKESLMNHIMNEASDFEILHAIVYEEFPSPNAEHDVFDEMILMSEFKNSILENYLQVCDMVNEDVLTEVLHTVDTITPYGLSTALPIIEHTTKTQFSFDEAKFWTRLEGHYNSVLAEQGGEDPLTAVKEIDPAKIKKAIAAVSAQIATSKANLKKAGEDIFKRKEAIKAVVAKKAGAADPAQVAKTRAALVKANQTNRSLIATNKDLIAKQSSLKHSLSLAYQKGRKGVATGAAAAGAKTVAALQAVGAKTGATAVATKVAAAGGYTLTPAAAAAGGGAAVIIGGAALATLLAYASVKTYKRLFGKWAKACAGKSGKEKTACMKEARSKAIQAQVADLQSSLKACADSKDPKKCSKAVAGKLGKLKGKFAKLR